MRIIILLGVVSILSACAMPQPGYRGFGAMKKISSQPSQQQAAQFVDEVIEVITEPPGARILVNGSGAGYSPVTVTARRLWRGDPRYPMTLDTVKIEAIPVEQGQCAQLGIFGEGAVKTPSQVRFDMRVCGAAPVQRQTR